MAKIDRGARLFFIIARAERRERIKENGSCKVGESIGRGDEATRWGLRKERAVLNAFARNDERTEKPIRQVPQRVCEDYPPCAEPLSLSESAGRARAYHS